MPGLAHHSTELVSLDLSYPPMTSADYRLLHERLLRQYEVLGHGHEVNASSPIFIKLFPPKRKTNVVVPWRELNWIHEDSEFCAIRKETKVRKYRLQNLILKFYYNYRMECARQCWNCA